jgi:hypothetical protein
VLTNKRGKALEEFLISRQIYTANQESCYKTFQSARGSSNIDFGRMVHKSAPRNHSEVKRWSVKRKYYMGKTD